MSNLIDYTLGSSAVANPDGSHPVTVAGATVVAGPGDTVLGHFDSALQFNAGSGGTVDLSGLAPDLTRFCVQVVFCLDAVPSSPQTLVASTFVPFSLTVERGAGTADACVVAHVSPTSGARAGASTAYGTSLVPGTWYTATLVYDTDTVAVYINNALAAVHAFPNGAVTAGSTKQLHLGHDVSNGSHFVGKMAAVQWQNDIPVALETALDAARANAQWFVSYKYEALPNQLAMGAPRSDLTYVGAVGAYLQHFEHGLLMYHDGTGVAFEMHGDIHSLYTSLVDAGPLGYLVSDEIDTSRPGGRKSLFSEGGIYWSPQTGAVPVIGHLYLDYESLGESSAIGLPVSIADPVPGGLEQVFQGARMYLKNGSAAAHEVHGDILARYLAIGGPAKWGFPLTDESDVHNGAALIGKFNEFEGCTIYWSGATGAHEVHGDIRESYRSQAGPAGALGFPTSDEMDIPGAGAPARMNTFQHGSLNWYGSKSSIVTALPFKVYLGRIDTVEDEGFGMAQNDIYFQLSLKDGGSTLFNQRFPGSGDYGDDNSRDADFTIPVTITPNRADMRIEMTVDVWDSDGGAPFGGGDDHLGTWTLTLHAENGWGLRHDGGVFQSGKFAEINNISASVQPQVDVASLTEGQKWWGTGNGRTPKISYDEYGDAFCNVDDQPEYWDITDGLDAIFYELVVKGLASGGNCFGMSLEGINARKGRSLYSLPLDRFKDFKAIEHEVNIKHCYQVGSGAVWWFVGEFLTGNTHDPVDVFNETEDCFARGDNPVLCLSQNADFSGAPHCIMPIAWDRSSSPWKMTVCDPNFPSTTRELTVDPNANTFHYNGGSVYNGTSSSGGRLHYMPYHLLSTPPHAPILDGILLILAGLVVILGSDARTESITDKQGMDLDAFGSRARQLGAGKHHLDDFFFSLKGVAEPIDTKVRNGIATQGVHDVELTKVGQVATGGISRIHTIPEKPDSPIAGEVLMRRDRTIKDVVLQRRPNTPIAVHVPIGTLAHEVRGMGPVAEHLTTDLDLRNKVGPMTVHQVAAHTELMGSLNPAAQAVVNGAIASMFADDFTHTVRGADNGTFDYAVKRGLTAIRVVSPISAAERMDVTLSGLATSKSVVEIAAETTKKVSVQLQHKLGIGTDHLSIKVDDIPISAGANVQINSKPGLGGVEILAGSTKVDVAVSIDAVINGRAVSQKFTVPMEGGVRIDPATVLSHGSLRVARIDKMFGPAISKAVLDSH